jgi:hypothetical protein
MIKQTIEKSVLKELLDQYTWTGTTKDNNFKETLLQQSPDGILVDFIPSSVNHYKEFTLREEIFLNEEYKFHIVVPKDSFDRFSIFLEKLYKKAVFAEFYLYSDVDNYKLIITLNDSLEIKCIKGIMVPHFDEKNTSGSLIIG